MSKVINVAYKGMAEYTLSSNVTLTGDFRRLKDEVQVLEKQLNNPRVYKGGWKFRMNRRHK